MIGVMDRPSILQALRERKTPWDVLVIGGGATGLGTAVDAASRGLETVLVERADFASGTSSRSTKLVHGGVRYLRQGRISLVMEALRERTRLLSNAAELVRSLAFIIPVRSSWEKAFYGVGLKLYEGLAGRNSLGPSEWLSREEVLAELPGLKPSGIQGGVRYWDAQFDDARLALALARTLFERGGNPLNYGGVTQLIQQSGRVAGAQIQDLETGEALEVRARVVVNATGVWCDDVRRLANPEAAPTLLLSQGAHLVLDSEFLPADRAMMVPRTEDGRVLFVIPWQGRCLLGTTDTPIANATRDPRPLDAEVDYLVREAGRWLRRAVLPADILSFFAGLRPLARPGTGVSTAGASREHRIDVSREGLITVLGGKWTTYRQMAEEVIDAAQGVGGWGKRPSATAELRLSPEPPSSVLSSVPLHPRLPLTASGVDFAARVELARTLEDVLSRRSRCLFLDAKASLEIAPQVGRILRATLKKSERWEREQLDQFTRVVAAHLPFSG